MRSFLWDLRVRSCLIMDVGAIVLVGLESEIAFDNGCGCDRTFWDVSAGGDVSAIALFAM